jgi:adenylate cyclase, class 2
MTLEVEAKAPCKGAKEKVESLGARFLRTENQSDTYYSHPSRDFKKTDEALRLRDTGTLRITYKGPKQHSDLKVRKEIEFEVPPDCGVLLQALGFKEAFTVRKNRRVYSLEGLTLCCDTVEGLGEYVEVESKDPKDHGRIMSVLENLGIKEYATTDSYSQLLGL